MDPSMMESVNINVVDIPKYIPAFVNIVYTVKNFQVGYVFDFPINGLRTYQYGSHEILLQYDLQPKHSSYHSPRYF